MLRNTVSILRVHIATVNVSQTTQPPALCPAGNSPNSCRHDSSLGKLTTKFIQLMESSKDGILDLNKAADKLQVCEAVIQAPNTPALHHPGPLNTT